MSKIDNIYNASDNAKCLGECVYKIYAFPDNWGVPTNFLKVELKHSNSRTWCALNNNLDPDNLNTSMKSECDGLPKMDFQLTMSIKARTRTAS